MEPNFQVPSERPSRVTRDYLLHLIRPAFGLPADLLPAAVDYLEAKGVIANNEVLGYHLPGDQDALLQVPREAERAMHGAILAHCQTPQCPAILQNVILMPAAGGSGSISQTGPGGTAGSTRLAPPPRNDKKRVEAITWHRARHIVELADFGAEAAARVLDHILTRLSAAGSGQRPHAGQAGPINSEPMDSVCPATVAPRMAESETHSQERPHRPCFATTNDLAVNVGAIVRHRIPDKLVPVVADYFVRVGVAAVAAQGQAAERATLEELHRAMASFAGSTRCPPILRYIIPGFDGALFAECPPHRMRDRGEICKRLEAEHAQHLASLVEFGDNAQEVCRSIELCVLCLMPDPADYPSPSPLAAALQITAALDEDLRDLGEQSVRMSGVEKLTAFQERLRKLRWKVTFSKESARPPSPPLSPRRGMRILPSGRIAFEEDPPPPPPDPAAKERLAWECEAGKQWMDALSVTWFEVVLPVVQSCRDVGELAQQHSAGEELIALTVSANRELLKHRITEPSEAALKLLDGIEAGMDLLWVRVTAPRTAPTASARPTEPEISLGVWATGCEAAAIPGSE